MNRNTEQPFQAMIDKLLADYCYAAPFAGISTFVMNTMKAQFETSAANCASTKEALELCNEIQFEIDDFWEIVERQRKAALEQFEADVDAGIFCEEPIPDEDGSEAYARYLERRSEADYSHEQWGYGL